MGFLSNRVKRSELEAGDHIYSWRTPVFAYSHHGIYIGGGIVMHFTQDQNLSPGNIGISSSVPNVDAPCLAFQDCRFRKPTCGVVMSCLNCFLGNDSLYRFQYGVRGVTLLAKLRPGTCTTAKSDPPEVVIHRAMYLLHNGFGKYEVFSHNCEDFALYCKTGLVVRSGKASVLSGQASSVSSLTMAAILALPLRMVSSNPYVFGATTLGNYSVSLYASDIGIRNDVVKVEVEDLAAEEGEDACAEDPPEEEGTTRMMDDSINSSGIEFCTDDDPCQLRLQPGNCQWFKEPCIGRVKEIFSDLMGRNQSLKEKLKSAEKDNALLAKSLNEYKIACDEKMIKLQWEKEMLKQGLNQMEIKFYALIMVCVLIVFGVCVRLI